MLRIAGINIPAHKHINIALTAVFGIGRSRAKAICDAAGVELSKKVSDLTTDEENNIRAEAGKYELEGDLRRFISMAIKRLKDLKCYRGLRHVKSLPLRGQRTHTNADSKGHASLIYC